jgi:hypothetical protein
MDMTVITQPYCQLYITCQLHILADTILAIIRLDTTIGENYTIYMIQYNHQSPSTYTNTDGCTVKGKQSRYRSGVAQRVPGS